LDTVFTGGDIFRFNDYFYSWSYDGKNWNPVHWETKNKDSKKGDALVFPVFTEEVVFVGHQVPMSYEDMLELIEGWEKSPCVKVHVVGRSLGGRKLCRLEISDAESSHPRGRRWVHYFSNQHPGEHNSQWRMVGMIDWLLSGEGADCRRRSISHFVLMMSPDAPSQGWYRVNAQGVDMNRSYSVKGADRDGQAHEAYLWQKDLEALMASEAPVTDLWGMHTAPGLIEPLVCPGPEMGTAVGPWTELREILKRNDAEGRIMELKTYQPPETTYWNYGPHVQFGITSVLCEGGGELDTKRTNLRVGAVLMKSIAEYYHGTRPVK
jgi:hypothetical protein